MNPRKKLMDEIAESQKKSEEEITKLGEIINAEEDEGSFSIDPAARQLIQEVVVKLKTNLTSQMEQMEILKARVSQLESEVTLMQNSSIRKSDLIDNLTAETLRLQSAQTVRSNTHYRPGQNRYPFTHHMNPPINGVSPSSAVGPAAAQIGRTYSLN